LVFEALKRWHKNKTLIVITHDLSKINPKDFVYVLKDGMVIEQGFRYDLEAEPEYGNEGEEGGGEFREMVEAQCRTGGSIPEKSPLTHHLKIPSLRRRSMRFSTPTPTPTMTRNQCSMFNLSQYETSVPSTSRPLPSYIQQFDV
jgi:ABC-type multidrug transport system ATPase subunit